MRQPHEEGSRHQGSRVGLRVRSAARGRVRLEAEALRDRPREAAAVERALQQMAGIKTAQATPLTGRLLVHHDTDLSAPEVVAMVRIALQAPRPIHTAGETAPNESPVQHYRTTSRGRTDAEANVDHPAFGGVRVWRHCYRLLRAYTTLSHRVPVQLQVLAFILLLALAVAQSWLVARALLALALIIIPMATARLLTARFTPWLICWMGFASCSAWLGLWLAAQTLWLPTTFIVTISLMLHLGTRCLVGKMGGVSRGLAYGQHRLSHLRV